jgi:hypothetical protein
MLTSQKGFTNTHRRWQRRGGLTGILGGTSIVRSCGLARDSDDQATVVDVPIRDGAVVLVAGSETGRCLCSAGPKVECGSCENASEQTETAGCVYI